MSKSMRRDALRLFEGPPHRSHGTDYYAVHCTPADELTVEARDGFYACLLFSLAPTTIDEKTSFARTLLETNCRFFVCGGIECETWHDIADRLIVDLEITEQACYWPHVMTTWHPDEKFKEVLEFFRDVVANRPEFPDQALILMVGERKDGASDSRSFDTDALRP